MGQQHAEIKDGAYFCYCAYVLRISRYSGFLWAVPTYSWFSRDVTKFKNSKPGGLQKFYLLSRKDYLKICLFTIS